MRNLKRLLTLIIAIILSSTIILPNSMADCATDCRAALGAADKVINDQQREIELYKTETQIQTKEIASLSVSLNEKTQEIGAWWHNPWVVGTLGILVGGAGALYLKR